MAQGRGRWLIGVPLGALVLALVLYACGGSSSSPAASAVVNPVAVSPFPGTPDASPATQISFLGPAGTHVVSIAVSGSRSGTHTGHLAAYSTGTGESFLPDRPFVPGEQVTVNAKVNVEGSVKVASTTFTIAHEATVSKSEFPNNSGDPQRGPVLAPPEPSATPSKLTVTTPPQPGAAPGDLFLAPYQGDGTSGPMIVNQQGQIVWFHALPPHDVATNFQVQSLSGSARAHLVAGACSRGRLRAGRRRHLQRLLPAHRHHLRR